MDAQRSHGRCLRFDLDRSLRGDVVPVAGLAEFNAALDNFALKLVPEQVLRLQRILTIKIFGDYILLTPVDTGRARAGWDLGVGELGMWLPKTPPKGSTNLSRAALGAQSIAEATVVLDDLRGFGVTWVVNNVHYIIYLDEGSSAQAPAGMSAVVFANLRAWLALNVAA